MQPADAIDNSSAVLAELRAPLDQRRISDLDLLRIRVQVVGCRETDARRYADAIRGGALVAVRELCEAVPKGAPAVAVAEALVRAVPLLS